MAETDLCFYMNFIFLNSADMLKEKMGGFLGGMAAKAINADDKVSGKVAEQLTEAIPAATAEMGLKIEAKTVYRVGALCTVKFTIDGADPVALVTKAKGDEAGSAMTDIIEAMGVLGVEGGAKSIEDKMLPKVKAGLMEKLAESIPAKMEEAGLKVKAIAKEPSEQAEWFYTTLEGMSS
mmetsp:Transcript_10871/g.16226  ORF Transcript_10871/g.16226 Transcript_10871/m.16226 type:complete len:179 (+) Transcript_10871:135-671(+)